MDYNRKQVLKIYFSLAVVSLVKKVSILVESTIKSAKPWHLVDLNHQCPAFALLAP